jgi:hypothetical protein
MKPITKKYIGIGVALTVTGIAIYFGYKFIDKRITEAKLRKAKLAAEKENPIVNTEAPVLKAAEIPKSIGKTLYPKTTYANLRSGAYVDNSWPNNFVGAVYKPNAIGKVLEVMVAGDGYTWYKVAPIVANLVKDKDLGSPDKKATTAYVREENVILK